jgi:hypothetical protein
MDSLLTNANPFIFIIVINGEKINLLGAFLIIVSDGHVCILPLRNKNSHRYLLHHSIKVVYGWYFR